MSLRTSLPECMRSVRVPGAPRDRNDDSGDCCSSGNVEARDEGERKRTFTQIAHIRQFINRDDVISDLKKINKSTDRF